jgi:DNA-directed RNA polymerase subunit RPC12/RpoP
MVWEESDDDRRKRALSETLSRWSDPVGIICPLCSAKLTIKLKPNAEIAELGRKVKAVVGSKCQ